MSANLRMIVAGGGTGGHFFPAQVIRNSLIEKGIEVKYIGSKFGIEATHFIESSNDVLLLNIRGIQRYLNIDAIIKNILFPYRFLTSYYKAYNFIKKFKPHIVIGTGGYSSGLPLLAAIHQGIKTIIQEQNSYPGITTRHLASKVDKICVAYKDVECYLKKENLVYTGNPIREDICLMDKNKAKKIFSLNNEYPVIAILGGSQGSGPINMYFKKYYKKYTALGFQILWQCGKGQYNNIKNKINSDNIKLIPFSNNMSAFYSAADIVLSRSGAIALSEMTFLGKAMILIPLPNSAGNHQEKNALTISKDGSAILFQQSRLYSHDLEKIIKDIIDNNKISEMERGANKYSIPNSNNKIIDTIMEIAQS